MVRCITCIVLHMRKFCRFLYCSAWFHTVEFNRLPCLKNEMYDDAVFGIRFHHQLTMFGIRVLIWLSRFFMLILHMSQMLTKSSQHPCEFPIVCLIWYGRIQSSAMFKQQDVRRYGFQWSILLSIDYVWSVYFHRAISTHWHSYCI